MRSHTHLSRSFTTGPPSTLAATLMLFISAVAHAQTYSVIYNFTATGDGGTPRAGVTLRAGSLYGTTALGGLDNSSTVFQSARVGQSWVTMPIAQLQGASGFYALAQVVFGPDGHPYSTTNFGGGTYQGVVFNLVPPITICKTVSCPWKENLIYDFHGGDGANPGAGVLAFDQQGNIYGTTTEGGPASVGTVYQLMRSGQSWTENVLYSFSGPTDGRFPSGGVVMDSNGNLFGTALQGGAPDYGTVFELTYMPGTGWVENTIYTFQHGGDGSLPIAGLIIDSAGNLYGAASDGGVNAGGTVFEITPSGFNVLHSFSGPQNSECGPRGNLAMDSAGNLYGTTYCDGTNQYGSVFKLTKSGNTWIYTSLHDFTDGADGGYPISNVAIDTDGTLYGTASKGGSQFAGVVWMIKP
jgi:uncharacterized repeat protein (TIGR03803 family)